MALLSYHFHNTTAEGQCTARLARALVDRGHAVRVVTSTQNSLEGQRVCAESGPLAGLTIDRVAADPQVSPRWWSALRRRAVKSRAWDKALAVPNLVHGCTIDEWAWVIAAARHVDRLWRSDGPFDILHSRLNPHTSHLAAMQIVKRIPGCAWCAYFSDPWPHSLYPEPYRFTIGPLARRRLESMLNRMLETSRSLVFPSARLRDHLLAGPRAVFRPKAFVAPHLSRSVAATPVPSPHDRLIVRHAGFLMKERRIEPIYMALRRLLADHPDLRDAIRVEFAGRYAANVMPVVPADIADIVRFDPYMDSEAVWNWIQDADVLLLVEARMREGIFFPSKLSDYLGASRPILALSPAAGVAADLLASGGGIVVDPEDEQGIAHALLALVERFRHGDLAALAPGPAQRAVVGADYVIPVYEQAFDYAVAARAEPAASRAARTSKAHVYQ